MSVHILNEMAGLPESAPLVVGSFKMWFLFWVGDPFTPERAMEKLRAMPDRAEARKILQKVKRSSLFKDDFRGLKL